MIGNRRTGYPVQLVDGHPAVAELPLRDGEEMEVRLDGKWLTGIVRFSPSDGWGIVLATNPDGTGTLVNVALRDGMLLRWPLRRRALRAG
ncbi:hypothetical protein [Caldinitratiruptor microaerophilus]|uniref:Uncharacterized protein n=1 Tax=Caldinitratiruptor microaerophilus TaxID=671077 RepID=A0AA35CPR1_9FIRM|nr:hypothetical protein [Caldinitratiruptor microaerophilus]BDG61902.1 hypothetical protein caldi_29920 [Caldinitratiruptor microaerophilus]